MASTTTAAPDKRCFELMPAYATPALAMKAVLAKRGDTGQVPAGVATNWNTTEPDTVDYAMPVHARSITSNFGLRIHPIRHTLHEHSGIDLAAPEGAPVYAAADGVVAFVGKNSGYGNYVILKHADAQQTLYGHLSRFADWLKTGIAVQRGTTIGNVGSTGVATGPHLHFEIRDNGRLIDPAVRIHALGSGRTLLKASTTTVDLAAAQRKVNGSVC
jgi:murein DD-endopeptidase MepM/ murein hydrolase activator NlpD